MTNRMPAQPVLAIVLLSAAALLVACADTESDDQGSGLAIGFNAAPPAAGAEVVFLRFRDSSAGIVLIDVVGRNISAPADGLNLAIAFDPAIAEANGVLGQTFLGTCGRSRPDNTVLVCADNVGNGGANQSGVLLFSAVPSGTPIPETIAGDVTLASISFAARSPGLSPVFFHDAGNPAAGGAFSEILSAADPNAAASVGFHPDAAGSAELEVVRSSSMAGRTARPR